MQILYSKGYMRLSISFILLALLITTSIMPTKHVRIETKIVINKPIEQVWAQFKCVDAYSKWNTLFNIEKFPTQVGQQIKVDLYDEKGKVKIQMQPVVLSLENYRLEWEGKLYVNGLFNGRHQFIFQSLDENTTELIQAEDFKGLLIPFLNRAVIQPTLLNFRKMNVSFKTYVETYNLDSNPCSDTFNEKK
ncbi:SRPBCC domain-containing protein [Acinetobacter bereziniae]|uniref:SRPBCC domain-containing protein n=1 Tax=Acinetobacter bereziniae TaxID=106648 RepID=UPI00124EFFF2|nr:SRPBCC domain-containing protein [Acinetobacter bereziniae]